MRSNVADPHVDHQCAEAFLPAAQNRTDPGGVVVIEIDQAGPLPCERDVRRPCSGHDRHRREATRIPHDVGGCVKGPVVPRQISATCPGERR